MSIALTDRVKVTDDVLSSRMGDETVLLNLKTGMYHGLDVVGTRFFELLKSTADLGGIHRQLLSEFDVPTRPAGSRPLGARRRNACPRYFGRIWALILEVLVPFFVVV